ncbi:uncharacterized protein LOC126594266 isoform X3 [Malus sylvestris]|uniref:uncharacterized protein LOC126594266 isoform X3 n=1 Tax=Malus sylvestris TaxID=3752 RepID=UPI0021AC31EE|nr:uncharacterized protein LOC126594266 isoform X3 [Malus sylvestris]
MVLRDHEQVEAMILIHSALSDDKRKVVNSVEAELTNMDLKSISAKSLPDPRTLQKSSHLLGSKVLQVNHTSLYFSLNFLVFCLIAEKIDEGKEKCGLSFATNSSSRRLLKLGSQKRRSWNKAVPVQNQAAAQKLPQKMSQTVMTSIQEADSLGERGGKRKSLMGKEKSRGKAFNWRCLYRYKRVLVMWMQRILK